MHHRLAGTYIAGLPQRIPMHLLYTVNVPLFLLAGSTIFRVTSAYIECTYNNSWTIYSGLSQRTNASILYSVDAPIIAGLYIHGYLSVYHYLLYTVN